MGASGLGIEDAVAHSGAVVFTMVFVAIVIVATGDDVAVAIPATA